MEFRANPTVSSVKKVTKIAPKRKWGPLHFRVYWISLLNDNRGNLFNLGKNPVEKNINRRFRFDSILSINWWKLNFNCRADSELFPFPQTISRSSVKKVTKIAPKRKRGSLHFRVYWISLLNDNRGKLFSLGKNPVEKNINSRFGLDSILSIKTPNEVVSTKFDRIQHPERGVSSESDRIQRQESDKNSTKEETGLFAFSRVLDLVAERQSRKAI